MLQTRRKYLQNIYLTKDLYSEYIKIFHNSVIRRLRAQFFKWAEYLNRHFSKEDAADQHIEKMLNIISH